MLAEYGIVNIPIPLDSIDSHWRKLNMSPSAPIDCEVVVDVRNRWTEEIYKINKCFIKANDSEKIILLKRIRELVNSSTSSLIEPEVKIRKRGKNVAK